MKEYEITIIENTNKSKLTTTQIGRVSKESCKVMTFEKMVKFFDMCKFKNDKFYLPAFTTAPYKIFDTNGTTKRCHNNIGDYSCLTLDYDDGYTIEDFQKQFKDYEFYLYTSSSHSEEKHKYRVILPLEEPLNKDLLYEYAPELIETFKGCDKSTFARARLFFLPTEDSIKTHNKGVLFNIDAQDYKGRPKRKVVEFYQTVSDIDIQALDHFMLDLPVLEYDKKCYAVANAVKLGTGYSQEMLWQEFSRDGKGCAIPKNLMEMEIEPNLGYFINKIGSQKFKAHKHKILLGYA